MKKTLIFFFFQFLISIFLSSESFAFTNISKNNAPTQVNNELKNTLDFSVLFIEEVTPAKVFNQYFYLKVRFLKDCSFNFNYYLDLNLARVSRNSFFSTTDFKTILTQQIFPFHFFW